MTALSAIFVFLFGAIVGSFLNVVVLRYGTGLSIAAGRSKCFSCGRTLSWYELIPIASFLLIGGKCRKCKSRISIQYPLVEFLTAGFFTLAFFAFGFSSSFFVSLVAISALIAIGAYDLLHMIIPDGLVAVFDIAALAFMIVSRGWNGLDFLAGFLLFSFFALFWLVSRGKWMGLGDAKLALGIGWMLGFSLGISAIVVSFWAGAAVGLLLIGLEKIRPSRLAIGMKSAIPFAPFIIAAFFFELFVSWNLLAVLHFG
ncbi:MAG: prepilin peptidase [Patescibacteria group bacterium]|nr:A24 family peptidase [Patescibacteria group bacterium]MDE1945621.1 prepilin peptidase [Patescibacteria group bacterium]